MRRTSGRRGAGLPWVAASVVSAALGLTTAAAIAQPRATPQAAAKSTDCAPRGELPKRTKRFTMSVAPGPSGCVA